MVNKFLSDNHCFHLENPRSLACHLSAESFWYLTVEENITRNHYQSTSDHWIQHLCFVSDVAVLVADKLSPSNHYYYSQTPDL